MKQSTPQKGPGGYESSESSSASAPSAVPPADGAAAGSKGDCGCSGGAASVSAPPPPTSAIGDAGPSIRPAEGGGAAAGITAWLNNKRITALWSINQNRNSWAHVEGIGWKRLANNSDSAIVALTMLAAHAREKASVVNYREESDGMIREMYVW
ncbi:MAG TPA: hypothetical protein VG796_03715 [Verrucomicrobiales bacterium]|nr:hypothetical protein [Verrucomicrobiales bacterium]